MEFRSEHESDCRLRGWKLSAATKGSGREPAGKDAVCVRDPGKGRLGKALCPAATDIWTQGRGLVSETNALFIANCQRMPREQFWESLPRKCRRNTLQRKTMSLPLCFGFYHKCYYNQLSLKILHLHNKYCLEKGEKKAGGSALFRNWFGQ